MRRRKRLVGIVAPVVAFLAISALLARALSEPEAERSEITALIDAEARGDTTTMLDRIDSCRASAACAARVKAVAHALTRPGPVAILQINTSTGFALSGGLGTARVAWKTASTLPIVQCVRVRRTGNALTGLHVKLVELSKRIPSSNDCPASY